MEWTRERFTVSDDAARLDHDIIERFLTESYWAKNIPLELVETALRNSLCFGAYDGAAQVGFARVITDYATFGYVSDVFVVDSHRGAGAGKQLMSAIREHPSLQRLRRWHLLTRDAHALYARSGFRPLRTPEWHMELTVENPYGRS